MPSYKEIVEAYFDTKVHIGYAAPGYDSYEEINTADGYEIFTMIPENNFSNICPDEHMYYYVDDMGDVIREHIKSSATFYVSERIAEELDMLDSNSSFWSDICEDEYLLEETE